MQPAPASDVEAEHQLSIMNVITGGLVAVGIPFVAWYWLMDVGWMSALVAATVVAGAANLAWAHWTGRLKAGGAVGATLLLVLLLASNVASGGFYDPNMAWLYVVPVLAALMVDARAGWVFGGLVLAAIAAFWGLEEVLGVRLPSHIDPGDHALQSLANRTSAILALALGLAALSGRDRMRRDRLAEANRALRAEMLERERVHAQLSRAQRLATVGEMAASVGHEVNNPLTYVLANLDLLQDELGYLPAARRGEARTMVSEALDGARRVRDIVGNLKSLSKEPANDPVKPVVLQDVLRRARILAPTHAMVAERVDDLPPVLAREGPLVQILVNLLANATHALANTADATIVVSGGTAADRVWVEVHDNGPGVPPAVAERIFEPFFTTRESVGTGLGLPICRSLAEEMGGTLVLRRARKGAAFRLELQRADRITLPSLAPVDVAAGPG